MEYKTITYQDIKNNEEISVYVKQGDFSMEAMGYTEHGIRHVTKCAHLVKQILTEYGSEEREIELGQIAAYMHDIGNSVNRTMHAQSGACMAFSLLRDLGMPPKEIARVVTAIGNHDEKAAHCINPIGAALILADKTDVRRSRVHNPSSKPFDIHDQVNYSVLNSETIINKEDRTITLVLKIDTDFCPVMKYFTIYTSRMELCETAAKFLGFEFKLKINGQNIL